jgi:hypothetical protein
VIWSIAAHSTDWVEPIDIFYCVKSLGAILWGFGWSILSAIRFLDYSTLSSGAMWNTDSLAWIIVGFVPYVICTGLIFRHIGFIVVAPIWIATAVFIGFATATIEPPNTENFEIVQTVAKYTHVFGVSDGSISFQDSGLREQLFEDSSLLRAGSGVLFIISIFLLLFSLWKKGGMRTALFAVMLGAVSLLVFSTQVGSVVVANMGKDLVTMPISDDSTTSDVITTVDGTVQKKEWKPDYAPYASSRPGKRWKSFVLFVGLIVLLMATHFLMRKKKPPIEK